MTRFLSLTLLLLATSPVLAQHRYFVGSRNLGMGGTGIASTTDAMAVHYNPAGMAFSSSWDLQVPLITADAAIGGDLFDEIDDINDLFDAVSLDEIQTRLNNGTATSDDRQRVLDAFLYQITDLDGSGQGGNVRGIAGPAFRWKNWGFSASVIGNGGVDTLIDLNNGLSLSAAGFNAAIPNPTPNACMGDPFCTSFAMSLVKASGGALDSARAETLVAEAGPALANNTRAQEILTDLVTATASGDITLANNETGVATTTLLASQFTATYSHLIYKDKLSVGGSINVIQGEADTVRTFLADLEDGEETFENAFDDFGDGETSTEVALDLGFMYRPNDKWSVGLTGDNLNAPSFDLPGGGEFELDPLVRAGVAYRPFRWFNVALDADLTEVESQVIDDFGYQYLNLGFEFLAGRIFSGWLGGYQNNAADSSDPIVTGGFGLRFGRFQFGLSVAASTGEVQLSSGEDDASFPDGAAASFTLAWMPRREPR